MKIGILASGGDGAGMNAFLYEFCKRLKKHSIFLFEGGYKGLYNKKVCEFSLKKLKESRDKGGIIIKTSRFPEFKNSEVVAEAAQFLKDNDFDVLCVMGGNGSYKGAKELLACGINIVFVPCTIDNDTNFSDFSIGFDTACDNAIKYIENVKQTMQSFDRLCVYEVMGRHNPSIATFVAENCNADYNYNSESCSLLECVKAIEKCKTLAPTVVLRENIVNIYDFCKQLQEKVKHTVKYSVIGHFQRGGNPTKAEMQRAKIFALQSVKCVKQKQFNVAIAIKNNSATFVGM